MLSIKRQHMEAGSSWEVQNDVAKATLRYGVGVRGDLKINKNYLILK
jgi:hypothetical protein